MANEVVLRDGRVHGEVVVSVSDADKAAAGRAVMEELGVPRLRTAFVGDSSADATLARIVGLSVAYATDSDKLLAVADHALPHGRLQELIPLLEAAGGGHGSRITARRQRRVGAAAASGSRKRAGRR